MEEMQLNSYSNSNSLKKLEKSIVCVFLCACMSVCVSVWTPVVSVGHLPLILFCFMVLSQGLSLNLNSGIG